MVAVGNIDTGEGFACYSDARSDTVARHINRVGVAEIDALVPEVENVAVGNCYIVAGIVGQRSDSIITTVEQAVVDSDVSVFITQKQQVGIGRRSRSLLGTQDTVAEGDELGLVNLDYIGKDVVARTTVVVGVEVDTIENDVLGIRKFHHMIGSISGGVCHLCHFSGTRNGFERDSVVVTGSIDAADKDLLVECLFAELEDNRTSDTSIMQGVEGNGESRIVAIGASANEIVASTEADVEGADQGVVGRHCVARDSDDGSDCMAARSEVGAQQRNSAGIA